MDRVEPHGWHGSVEEWLAWLDGELPPTRHAELREHVNACPSCEALLAEVREAAATLATALASLDAPPPVRNVGAALHRATRRRILRALPAAAVLVLLLAGATYALVPGPSIRGWIRAWRSASPSAATIVAPSHPPLFSVAAPDSLDVVVGRPQDSLSIQVVRSSGRWLSVGAPERGAPGVELGERHLRIYPDSAHLITLVIPLHSRVRIRAGGRTLLKVGFGPTGDGPVRDSVILLRVPTGTGPGR